MTCGNSAVDRTYSYSVHDASYCTNTKRDISISWAKPRVQKQTYFCFIFLQEHANFICFLHVCRKLSPITDIIDVSLCKQHLHSFSKTYHRGVEPAHGRKLSCCTAGAQLHEAVGVSGIFNVGQAFAPGRGGHEPEEGKGSSQQQVLPNTNAHQCMHVQFSMILNWMKVLASAPICDVELHLQMIGCDHFYLSSIKEDKAVSDAYTHQSL